MNEGRLPSWVRLPSASTGAAAGSPRRVAQFDDLRYGKTSSSSGCSSSCSATQRCHTTIPRLRNPFLSTAQQNSLLPKQIVEDFLDDNTNMLTIYCRQGLWEQALERCETHPHEARPTPCKSDFFEEESWSPFFPLDGGIGGAAGDSSGGDPQVTLYEPTPLGILCSSNNSSLLQDVVPTDTIVELVWALCDAGDSVSASQKKVGHTPLRAAIVNPSCPSAVMAILLKQPHVLQALKQPDEHGVYPFDHLLQRVRRQANAEEQEEILDSFLKNAPLKEFSKNLDYSPLVRFYSMVGNGKNPGGLQQSWRHQLLSVPSLQEPRVATYLLLVTQKLTESIPCLLNIPSRTTGCMPIHAAIRNYGNMPRLMELLMSSHKAEHLQFMLHRNNFGDSPLHVACACGVPLQALRLILARTVQGATSVRRADMLADPVLWATNHAGYTPVDLEWIHHIEAGNGFFSHSVFQPIGVEGIPRPRGRYDDLYQKLLRQAVDQVMTSNTDRSRMTEDTSHSVFGLLLHRIFLIIRATFHDSFSQSPFDLSADILHQASALFQPRGPSMPEAIMDLLLWQYPEQAHQLDHLGRTPLHHAVHTFVSSCQVSLGQSVAWERWIQKLLKQSSPTATRIADARGRYPLHAALDCRNGTPVVSRQVHNAICQLLGGSPEVLQVRDPVSRLFPALQAATHQMLPLETVYCLIRHEPGVIYTS